MPTKKSDASIEAGKKNVIQKGDTEEAKRRGGPGDDIRGSGAKDMNKKRLYDELTENLAAASGGVGYTVSVLANASALLMEALPDVNWCGFYLYRDGKLVLGPFQGKIACTEIDMGKGVCGTAAEREEAVLVEDVRLFDGHIACDSASRSEIVVPIHRMGKLFGVLDIDSPLCGRFSEEDRNGLLCFTEALEKHL